MSDDRLYGQPDDEHLHVDLDEAVTEAVDRLTWREEWSGEKGAEAIVEVTEFSVFPKGESPAASIPDGRTIAERIVETYWEDVGFEDCYEQLYEAASDDDVIAAFQAARDLLVSKQSFLIADGAVEVHRFKATITTDLGDWDYVAVDP